MTSTNESIAGKVAIGGKERVLVSSGIEQWHFNAKGVPLGVCFLVLVQGFFGKGKSERSVHVHGTAIDIARVSSQCRCRDSS